MNPKKMNPILHRCTALFLAFVMVFTGAVAPGISGWTGTYAYADTSWEEGYLDVKDGTLTKGELYDSFVTKFGSGSYKYAESKPRLGWASGGTEVTSGNEGVVTLEHNQTYAVGKKGRYTWTASTDYTFTARVFYLLTGSDGDVTIGNGGKVYEDEAANITITAKEGYHGQIWFADKLQTTIEDGQTTGSFVPTTSGEVTVVYVESSRPKHNVSLEIIGEEFGTASLDFSGEQQEGTPITLTATPADNGYLADMAIEGAEFGARTDFDGNRGQSASFDVATSDIKVTVTFKEQKVGFGSDASYDEEGNLKVYINGTSGFDVSHIEATLYNLLAVDPSGAKPAADQVQVQFLSTKDGAESVWRDLDFEAPTGDWAWINPANGYAEFPQLAGETAIVRLSWAESAQYPAGSIEQQIVLEDHRIPTTIEGTAGTITYGASDAEILKAFGAHVVGADGMELEAEDLTISYEGALNVEGSPYTITVSYPGNETYQPSKAKFKLTVKKAKATIQYNSQVITYGEDYTFDLEKNPADVDTINFMIGIDGAAKGATEYLPVTHVYLMLPDSFQELNGILDLLLGEDNTLPLGEVISVFEKMADTFSRYLEEAGISVEAVESVLNTLDSVTESMGVEALNNVMVTINPQDGMHPENIGVYVAGAVSTDNNYETTSTVGYLVIVPDATKAELQYHYDEFNGIITQNLLTDGEYDLGADAYVEETFSQEATDDLAHLFLQVVQDGSIQLVYADSNDDLANHVASGELTKTGIYEQITFMPELDNQMYYAIPIARTYTVLEDGVNVQFVDSKGKVDVEQEFQCDGLPKSMAVKVTSKDGNVLPIDERLTVRYIGVDARGIQFYNSTEEPTNVGVYKVFATYKDPETGLVGMASGKMTITAGKAAIQVVSGTFEYDENYTVQVNTTPEDMYKIVAIVSMSSEGDIMEGEIGKINVDLPKILDILLQVALPWIYRDGVALQDLMDLADKIKSVMDLAGLDSSSIDQILGMVTEILGSSDGTYDHINITFKDTEDVKPLPIGSYTVVGLSCDLNYEIGVMGMGMINITEKKIEQRKIVITVEDVVKTYGDKDPEFKWSYEIVGKTENEFYEGHDFEQVIVGGSEGVSVVNMAGEDANVGVYKEKLYPTAYVQSAYQKYYSVETKRGTMTVLQKNFDETVKLEGLVDKVYTGKEIKQENLVVKAGRISLRPGVDYDIVYKDNVNVGQASVTIVGKGNYSGTLEADFMIQPRRIEASDVADIDAKKYTGEEITPEVSVVVDGVTLKEGKDYTVTYENNLDAGQAKVIITGIGNYTTDDGSMKTVEKTFDINPANLSAQIEKKNYVYDGTAKEPAVTVKNAVKDVDYTVTYQNNVNAGKGKVIVEGKGNYTGKVESEFSIFKATLTIVVKNTERYYGEPNPEFQVQYEGLQGNDTAEDITGLKFDCAAQETSKVGKYTIKASGATSSNYTIYFVDGKLTVVAKSISDAEITCPEKTYNGSAHKPKADELVIKINGRVLKENTDFKILGYENNINAGTAMISIKGLGNYTDTIKVPFQIAPAKLPDCELEYKRTTYDGTAKEPKVTIQGLKEGVDYTVAYKDNTIAGTAKVVITGVGNYSGLIEKSFTIDKAKDSITLSMTGWTYGDPANSPDGESASGNPVTYQYLQGGKVVDGVPTAAGTYYVKATVEDSDNYEGFSTQRPFTIVKRSLEDENIRVDEIVNQRYTGQEVTPEVTIYDGYREATLSESDYTLVYRDNTEVGVATVTIVGKGNYTDSVTKEFNIREFGFFGSLDLTKAIYNGSTQKPVVEIPGYVEGVDYTVTYETDFISVGTHTVVITGIGDCEDYGTETLYFYIEKAQVQVAVKDQTVTYGEPYEFTAEPQGLIHTDVLAGEAEFHYYADQACTVEIEKPENAGTYYVKASGFSAENYDITYVTGTLVIEKAENAWVTPLSIKGWVAGKKSSEPKAEAKSGEVTYKYFADKACKKEIAKPTKAGTYYVKAYVAECENYLALESEAVSFVIKKAAGKTEEPDVIGGTNDDDEEKDKEPLKDNDDDEEKDKDKVIDKEDEGKGPNTGDSNHLTMWFVVLATSLLGVGVLTKKRRRSS